MTPLRSLYVAIVLSFIGIVQAQQPSGTPQCTPSCPPKDIDGLPLGDSSNSGGELHCSYPFFQGVGAFSCIYDSSTGSLVADHDDGYCPPTATMTCVNSRRFKGEDNYTAMLRKKREAAAMMPRSSEPRADPRKLKARKPSVSL
ncbi:hypothetical protein MSAN_01785100 [Mycena sanguinolenta]|uniref:Uncharacterized protein n=1 Tax=Mycena sanguinolenta TaxID=230812 RepID=A0A8H7CUX8_9AGAR|nr:hypothetical protein MSAN_01785100 [Mycena sanguinolenta]